MINPIKYLYFHARLNADSVATRRLGGALTYGQLLTLVRGIAYKLRERGVKPGQVVVTCLKSQYTDWIFNLAAMHEAAVTCSNHGFMPFPQELDAGLVITERPLQDYPQDGQIVVDDPWLQGLPTVPEDFSPVSYGSEDSLFRLVLTSGTTGQSKIVGLTVGETYTRCSGNPSASGPTQKEFCFLALSTLVGFKEAFIRLQWGGTFFHAASYQDVIRLVEAYQIECLCGSPIQLAGLVAELERTMTRLPSLKLVWYGGGEASPRLVDHLRRDLCSNVICRYGSTEVGGVSTFCVHDPAAQKGMAGYVVPEVTVQIVDENREILGAGEEGTIRIKSLGMAAGYYNNPGETQRSFLNGWFYPGDRGRILENGALILSGRTGELINRGGIKIDPMDIDYCVQNYPGVKDAAAFGFENLLGLADVCVAVVAEDGCDINELQRYSGRTLGVDRSPSVFLRIQEIPRNQMGKPMRRQMQDQLSEGLRRMLQQRSRASASK
jgi:acyl-coenzyme A synthetase/AMP-(fatty) acid ligase